MKEEITLSQNKGLNFVLKLPDLNEDLITPLTDAIMMDIHRRTNLSQLYLGVSETHFKPPFLHVNLMFQNGNESTVQAAYGILRPLFMLAAIMGKLTPSQVEKFLQQIHQWHEDHPTELLMPYDQVDIKIPLLKDCGNDHQELKKLFNTPLEILEKYIKLYSNAPYYHIDTEVTEKDGISYFNIHIGDFLNAVGLGEISNKGLIDTTIQTINLLAESQLPIVERIMYDQAVAQVLIDPEDPNPEETVKAIMKNYYGAKFMKEEKQPTEKSNNEDDNRGVALLKFDETFPIPYQNMMVNTILPEVLKMYIRSKATEPDYLIYDFKVETSEKELRLSFEYAKKDGTKFNKLAPAFQDVLVQAWGVSSLRTFFDILNKQTELMTNELIFSLYQYFVANPKQTSIPMTYLEFEVTSALFDDTKEKIIEANANHYFEALNKIERYLNQHCKSPFYLLKTSAYSHDEKTMFVVSIYSLFNALDMDKIQRQEYVKSVLLAPSIELGLD